MLSFRRMDRKHVAANLRRLRVARGVSQEALAADAEIDRTYVGRLERGLTNPSVGVLEKLAKALAVPIVEFFVVPNGIKGQRLPGGPKMRRKHR